MSLIRRRRIIRRPCYACQRVGQPLTAARFCATCADIVCLHGDGERAGLPVPSNVSAAVAALERHYLGCPRGRACPCLVCALLAQANPWCPDCRQPGDGHITVGRRVVVGCRGYVASAVRAAARLVPVT